VEVFHEGTVAVICVSSCAFGSQGATLHTRQEVLQQSTAAAQGKHTTEVQPFNGMGSARYIFSH